MLEQLEPSALAFDGRVGVHVAAGNSGAEELLLHHLRMGAIDAKGQRGASLRLLRPCAHDVGAQRLGLHGLREALGHKIPIAVLVGLHLDMGQVGPGRDKSPERRQIALVDEVCEALDHEHRVEIVDEPLAPGRGG